MNNSNELPIRVLFVCMGNICRSPSAEAVMNAYISESELSNKILCDSAGTISHHAGEPADARMKKHALRRGFNLTSISRQVESNDFEEFDYIIGMDDDNMVNMQPFIQNMELVSKLSKMTNYCASDNPGYVPDPYYGGDAGFEQVLDILEDACKGLLDTIKQEQKL